jgi:valyl-tRNA synthetase
VNKLWNIGKYTQHALLSTNLTADEVRSLQIPVQRIWSTQDLEGLPLAERYIISRVHSLVDTVTRDIDQYKFGEAGRALHEFLWDDLADWFVEMSKCHLRDGGEESQQSPNNRAKRLQTLRVLVYVWDLSLRMLHPFMPFVTETLWQNLPRSTVADDGESLMMATWPSELVMTNENVGKEEEKHMCVDVVALRDFGRFQNVVRAIRNARAEHGVELGRKVSCIVQSSPLFLQALQGEGSSLTMLAKIDDQDMHYVPTRESDEEVEGKGSKVDVKELFSSKAPFVHVVVDEDCEVFLPQSGLLDRVKEKARLTKQAEKLQKDIAAIEGRLSNESFVQRAPAQLVQEARQKMMDYQQQLSVIDETLRSL